MRYFLLMLLSTATVMSFAQTSISPEPEERKVTEYELYAGVFKTKTGLRAIQYDFDFDADCRIHSYELLYIPKREDAIGVMVNGETFNDAALRLIELAKPGDFYFFESVKAICPGDQTARKLSGILVKIK